MKSITSIIGALVMMITPLMINAQNDPANMAKYREHNKALMESGKVENRIVFMGNSITEFWNLKESFGDKPYVNRGISGQTTPQMLMRFKADVIELQPEAVVILAGINDIAENSGPIPLKETAGNIFRMVELAKDANIRPIMCSVLPAADFPWRPGLKPATKIVELNQMLREYAKSHNIPYVDYYSKMADKNLGLKKSYSGDGVHPNDTGYKVMSKILAKTLRNL